MQNPSTTPPRFQSKGGNVPAIQPELMDIITAEIHQRSIEGVGFSSYEQFKNFLAPYLIRSWHHYQKPGRPTCSKRTIMKYLNMFCQNRVITDTQNLRRLEVYISCIPAISTMVGLYCTLKGANGGMYPRDLTGVNPEFITNSDATTISFNSSFDKGKGWIGKSAAQLLRGVNRSIQVLTGYGKCLSESEAQQAAAFVDGDGETGDYIPDPICYPPELHNSTPQTKSKSTSRIGVKCDFNSQASTGKAVASFVSIKCDEITNKDEPVILLLDKTRRIFLMLYHPQCDSTKIAELKQEYLIFDTTNILRQNYVKELRRDITKINSSEDTDNDAIITAANEIPAVHFMDGELICLNAAIVAGLFAYSDQDVGDLEITVDETEEEEEVEEKDASREEEEKEGREEHEEDGKEDEIEEHETVEGNTPPLLFPNDESKIPENFVVCKLHASGSAGFQPNDVTKAHQVLKQLIQNGTDMICDVDSYRLPTWHRTLWNLLVSLGIKPPRMRSIYQFCINIPHWIDKAWSNEIGREGWSKVGIFPWNPVQTLSRWAGAASGCLKESFYHRIFEEKWDELCDQYQRDSTLFQEDVIKIIGKGYIDDWHKDTLSDFSQTIVNNMMERLEKNASRLKTVSQWGLTTLNKNFYARREAERARLEEIATSNQLTQSVYDQDDDYTNNMHRVKLIFQALGFHSFDTYKAIRDENGVVVTTTIRHKLMNGDVKSFKVPRLKTIKNKRYINYMFDKDHHYNGEDRPKVPTHNQVGDLKSEFFVIKLCTILCKAARDVFKKNVGLVRWNPLQMKRKPHNYFVALREFMKEDFRSDDKSKWLSQKKIEENIENYERWCQLRKKEALTLEEELEVKKLTVAPNEEVITRINQKITRRDKVTRNITTKNPNMKRGRKSVEKDAETSENIPMVTSTVVVTTTSARGRIRKKNPNYS